jgi:hypothetical protein
MNRPDDLRGGPARPLDPRASPGIPLGQRNDDVRIPIVEEQVAVGKRTQETGRVRVSTHVEEEHLKLAETIGQEVVEVERVPVGLEVDHAPAPFERDGVLIVPVVEERIVVEKKLFVVEEIRLHRHRQEKTVEIPATRRVMRADVERLDADVPPPIPDRPAMFGQGAPPSAAPLGAHARPPAAERAAALMPDTRVPPPVPETRVPPPTAATTQRVSQPAQAAPKLLPWLIGFAALLALVWLLSSLSGGDDSSSTPEQSRVGALAPSAQEGRPASLILTA